MRPICNAVQSEFVTRLDCERNYPSISTALLGGSSNGRFSVTRKNGTKSKQRITNPIRQLLDNSGYLYCGSA